MSLSSRTFVRQWCLGLMVAFAFAHTALAEDDDDEHVARVALLPQYQQECGACHLAFPPGFLPASSWQRLMNNLPKHFGTDASLDAATTQTLTTWLTANAGTYKHANEAPPEDRISRSAWFIHEHNEDFAANWWKLRGVKSASNCAACHFKAEQGDFSIRVKKSR
jgi:hypothetical protein